MEPRWLTEREGMAWRSFVLTWQLLDRELGRDLEADAGLSHAYYTLLVGLSEAPGRRCRMSELAEFLQFSRSRISHAISRLEGLGWVRREDCPDDRRGSFAVLTDEGLAKLVAAAPGHVESVRRYVFDRLTEEQVDQLGTICRQLVDPFNDEPLDGPLAENLRRSGAERSGTGR